MSIKKCLVICMGLFLNLISFKAQAADIDFKWSELRLFLSNNSYTDDNSSLNNLGTTDNIEKMKSFAGFGLEADAKLNSWFKVGTRFKGIFNSVYPPGSTASYIQLSQYSAGLLGRVPLVDSNTVLVDIFAELGASNNKIEVKTSASGSAEFTKDSVFFQRVGASVGLGWPSFKIFAEAGQEFHKIESLNKSGSLVNTVNSVDLSGPYISAGLIISGMPSWIKPGGISTGK